MKKLFIIIFTLSLLGCSKDSPSDGGGVITQKAAAKSFFANLEDLEVGIGSAQQGYNEGDLNPQQVKIAEMLRPCIITYENTDEGSNNTVFSGERCPIHYIQKSNFGSSDLFLSVDFITKSKDFEKLAKFSFLNSEGTSKITSTEGHEKYTESEKTKFNSISWGTGVYTFNSNFNGKYVGDKKHMDFTLGVSMAVKSEKLNLTITANAAGNRVTDDNGNIEQHATSYQCTLNGTPVNCEELQGIPFRSLFK